MTAINTYNFAVAGITVRQDQHGRFSLNDLHKAAGGEKRHQPSDWAELQQTKDLIAEISNSGNSRSLPIESSAGRYGGTYVCKELVYAYAMWISAKFQLQVISAYDELVQQRPSAPANNPVAQELEALEVLARFLNVAPSGKITMARCYLEHAAPALLPALPGYAVDAPQGAIAAGSSAMTFSATDLLKRHGIKMATHKFNEALHDAGLLEQAHRKSANGGYKKFWSVTVKGEWYGKNVTSAQNPRETQPHWYEHRFPDLLEAVGILSPA